MNHPEILFVPVLLFAQYFLSPYEAKRRAEQYGRHFLTPDTNPPGQQPMRQGGWRGVLLILLITILFLLAAERGLWPETFLAAMLGFITIDFSMLAGRALYNLTIYEYLSRNPDEVSGQVVLQQKLMVFCQLSTASLF